MVASRKRAPSPRLPQAGKAKPHGRRRARGRATLPRLASSRGVPPGVQWATTKAPERCRGWALLLWILPVVAPRLVPCGLCIPKPFPKRGLVPIDLHPANAVREPRRCHVLVVDAVDTPPNPSQVHLLQAAQQRGLTPPRLCLPPGLPLRLELPAFEGKQGAAALASCCRLCCAPRAASISPGPSCASPTPATSSGALFHGPLTSRLTLADVSARGSTIGPGRATPMAVGALNLARSV
mmetsp:Transcript_25870/g.97427  ORF Transcript_25870/g.97427 Transcript_25870/m.97427 type:complete len:238 (-) Transcript_25870:601-1314(-)